jgi:hypothetical protein
MNANQIQSLIRAVLLSIGASLVARGTLTDATLQEVVGAVLSLGSIAWSMLHHSAPKPTE